MTLDEAIEELTKLRAEHGGDIPLILAKDNAENGFSPATEVSIGMYEAETTYSGDYYLTEEDRQSRENPDDYWEAPENAVRAVFMWPTD